MTNRAHTSIAATPEAGRFSPIPLVGPFRETFPQAADLGFDGVELHIRSAHDPALDEIDRLLATNGLMASAIATGQPYLYEGICFTAPEENQRRAAVAAIHDFTRVAERIGASLILGYIRGGFAEDPGLATRQRQWMLDCCRECSDFAAGRSVTLLLEPINRYEMNDFNTVASALAFADEVGYPNFQLMLDTFHMNIEEPSITASIRQAAGRAPYLHVVDSNRWAPGYGHTDFEAIAHTLREISFSGFLSAEILRLPDYLTASRRAIEAYRAMLDIINARDLRQPM